MFGKFSTLRLARQRAGFNPRVRGTCLVSSPLDKRTILQQSNMFQSPCAGNMFGKERPRISETVFMVNVVSIPVCGEHVW